MAAANELPKTDRGWQTYLQNIRPPAEREWLTLGSGLSVCLETSGAKTFQARIRRAGDVNPRRINLGAFPAVSVAEARTRLAEAKSLAKEGRDPAVERRRAKAGVSDVRTLGALIDVYLERRESEGGLKNKTLKLESSALETLRRRLGDRLLSDLEPRDIGAVVQSEAARLQRRKGKCAAPPSRGSGRAANNLLAATKRMYRHARGWGVYTGGNPAADLSRPAAEKPRERILYDPIVSPDEANRDNNEVGALLRALRSPESPVELERETKVAVELSLALGLRASEVAALEWAAVELGDDMPSLSVTRSKTAAGVRTLPLTRQALAALRALHAERDKKGKHVFPPRSDAKRAEHLHPESLSRAFSRVCAKLKIGGATFHDLRRTCLTAIGELTGDDALAERIAGHKGTTTLAKHYDKSKRLAPMLAALQEWADALDRIYAAAVKSSETIGTGG
ncbi:MAG: integrase family protein [Rhodoblastus sp.]|nr:integrase family protein [Rhodoblastus sp.]